MAEQQNFSKSKQIRQLLFVVGMGVLAAFLLAFGMLHYYNPSGVYLARNVLMAPEGITSIHFSEGKVRFVLNDMKFSYYDEVAKQMKSLHIDMPQYESFYRLVGNDRSLEIIPDDVRNQFNSARLASIDLSVREEMDKSLHSATHLFLRVEFANSGNYYRAQLRMQDANEVWAYFHRKGIYNEVLTLFIPIYD